MKWLVSFKHHMIQDILCKRNRISVTQCIVQKGIIVVDVKRRKHLFLFIQCGGMRRKGGDKSIEDIVEIVVGDNQFWITMRVVNPHPFLDPRAFVQSN